MPNEHLPHRICRARALGRSVTLVQGDSSMRERIQTPTPINAPSKNATRATRSR